MAGNHMYRVGALVRFHFGSKRVDGVVKEDRGPIGRGGRRLYRIQYSLEPHSQAEVELPADELELVKNGAAVQALTPGR